MFVLEKLLRGLSEETGSKDGLSAIIPEISFYNELIGKVDELRKSRSSKIDSEYYQKLRMLVDPYLKRAAQEIQESSLNLVDNLKIIMFAHDNKLSIPQNDEIDWIGVIKRIMDVIEGNEGLIVRILRYLKTCDASDTLETVPLLLMNTLNKMLITNKCNDVLFVIQVLNLIDSVSLEGNGIEKNLFLLLRSSIVNDRLKAMIVRILKAKMNADIGEMKRMLGEDKRISAVISAELGNNESHDKPPASSSKAINYLNGHFETFSVVEQAILSDKYDQNGTCSNGYERFLLASSQNINNLDDRNVLRELFRRKQLTVDSFIEKLEGKIEIKDFEMIVCHSHQSRDINSFWKFMNKIPWLTMKIKDLEPKREFFIKIDLSTCSLPAQHHFFKILVKFRDLEATNEHVDIAIKLYERYSLDSNCSEVFKAYIDNYKYEIYD